MNTSETLPSIIYVQSASGCPSTYSLNTSYATNNQGQYYGACGDVYVHGNYTQPLTIVSDHDIIIVANNGTATPGITTNVDGSGNPTGNSTLGLVAGDFVRVMHSANTNVERDHHRRGDPHPRPLVHGRQLQLQRRSAHRPSSPFTARSPSATAASSVPRPEPGTSRTTTTTTGST